MAKARKGKERIDSVPIPDSPPKLDMEVRIPVDLLRHFEKEVRIVIRHPWVVGIPVPEKLMPELVRSLGDQLEVIITPKQK